MFYPSICIGSSSFAFYSFIHLLLTQVVSVVLENYGEVEKDSEKQQLMRIISWRMVVNEKGQVNVPT